MNSTGIKATIAGALLAASANATPADMSTYPINSGDNVITLAQAQKCSNLCATGRHVVQSDFVPQNGKTNLDYLERMLGPAFEKAGKNALILISDKPISENQQRISQMVALAQRLYDEKGVVIHYVMQVYASSQTPRSESLEGTVRLYRGGFPMDKNPATGRLIRNMDDVEHVLKVAAPNLMGKREVSSAQTGGDGNATSTGIQPPDLIS